MARNLREALDEVVTKITWKPDKTALVHDAEALNTLIGYIVMETSRAAPSPALTREALDLERLTDAVFYLYGNVTRRGASIGPDRPGPTEGYRPRSFWREDAALIAAEYDRLAGRSS